MEKETEFHSSGYLLLHFSKDQNLKTLQVPMVLIKSHPYFYFSFYFNNTLLHVISYCNPLKAVISTWCIKVLPTICFKYAKNFEISRDFFLNIFLGTTSLSVRKLHKKDEFLEIFNWKPMSDSANSGCESGVCSAFRITDSVCLLMSAKNCFHRKHKHQCHTGK